MVSFKRPSIYSLLFLIVISTQSTIALTYLPESSYYSGTQYRGIPGDWVRVEFAVYNNGGAEFSQGVGGYALPSSLKENESDELSKFEYIYAYQIINEVSSADHAVDFFSIGGFGKNAINSAQDIGWVADETGEPGDIVGQKPGDGWLALENDVDGDGVFEEDDDGQYFYSAHWEFDRPEFDEDGNIIESEGDAGKQFLDNGKHSYFLLIGSDYDYRAGAYTLEQPPEGGLPIPGPGESSGGSSGSSVILNPEPCTLVLFGLGSILLSKRQRKK